MKEFLEEVVTDPARKVAINHGGIYRGGFLELHDSHFCVYMKVENSKSVHACYPYSSIISVITLEKEMHADKDHFRFKVLDNDEVVDVVIEVFVGTPYQYDDI